MEKHLEVTGCSLEGKCAVQNTNTRSTHEVRRRDAGVELPVHSRAARLLWGKCRLHVEASFQGGVSQSDSMEERTRSLLPRVYSVLAWSHFGERLTLAKPRTRLNGA